MTRIAVIPSGITSTLNTNLELARRLAEHGHEVTFVGSPELSSAVESHGFRHVELRADRDAFAAIAEHRSRLRTGSVAARVRAGLALIGAIRRGRRSTVDAHELLDAIDALGPDLVLVDYEAHVAIVACRGRNVPTALTTAYFAVEPNDLVPPIDSWLTPDDGRSALAEDWRRVHHASDRVRRRAWLTSRRVVDLVGPLSYRSSSPTALRAVARRTGAPLDSFTDRSQWMRPWGYRGLPVLTTNLRELEFGSGGSANWIYVGPMVDRSRPDPAIAPEDRGALDDVLDRCRRDPQRRLVYCSLGSYWTSDLRLLSEVIEVFRRRSDWELVVGLGARGEPERLADVPSNVLALRWAPQVELLTHADAAVVHGGNATLNECVSLAVPMVVCSTGHLDQNGVASRVAHAGIGRARDGRLATADWIERSLDTVMTDAAVARETRRFADIAGHPNTIGSAVDAVNDLIGR